jgi:acetyl-CoA C-acetyltransferase
MASPEVDAGLWDPVAQYACIETALAAAEGLDAAHLLDGVASLWARFAAVARRNPDAAFPIDADEAFLRGPGPDNRLLAWPYAKWHSTQWSVDQGAALILCAAGTARELGVPPQRWVLPAVLVDSSASVSLSRRAELHRWPAMGVLGAAAEDHLGRPLSEVDHVELYSCFPAAVRVQQRELGLDPDRTPTVTGGMAFAGGPFNHFTYQATAAMARRLRDRPGELGLVTTVSGLLTKPGLAVWSTPGGSAPTLLAADLAPEATRRTAVRDVTGHHEGPGTVVAHTVLAQRGSPARAFLICDLPDGRRWVGTSEDERLLSEGTRELLAGRSVAITGATARP